MKPLPDSPALGPKNFTLGQLMLWTMATCLALAHEKWRLSSGENQDPLFLLYANIRSAIYAPLTGAGTAGLMLFVWRRVRGGSAFPTEPGHWFLLIHGVQNVVYFGWEVLNSYIGPDDLLNFFPAWFTYSEQIVFDGLIVALTVAAAAKPASSCFWRAAFLAMALNPLSQVLHSTLVDFYMSGAWFINEFAWSIGSRVIYSMPATFALAAAITDWRARQHHDFLHWAGVALIVALAVIEWPVWIVWHHLFR